MNPRLTCDLLVGLGEVAVVGLAEMAGDPHIVQVESRFDRAGASHVTLRDEQGAIKTHPPCHAAFLSAPAKFSFSV